ncbi:MAG: hypothetical protein WCZ28_12950 [Burkholderiaceae bacterium]
MAPIAMGAIVLATMIAVTQAMKIDFGYVSRDLAVIHELHPLGGMLSALGVLLWCAAATASLVAGLATPAAALRVRLFLFASAVLSAWLMLDDGFMIHEMIAPVHLHIGERWVILGLGILCAGWLIAFGRLIVATRYGMLVLAFVFLGASLGADLVILPLLSLSESMGYLLEDGAKWIGILFWFTYHLRTAVAILRGEILTEFSADPSSGRTAQPQSASAVGGRGQPVAGIELDDAVSSRLDRASAASVWETSESRGRM